MEILFIVLNTVPWLWADDAWQILKEIWLFLLPTPLVFTKVRKWIICQVRLLLYYLYIQIPLVKELNKLKADLTTTQINLVDFKSMMHELVIAINDIKKEFVTNGGSSLKDDLNSIRLSLRRLTGRQKITYNDSSKPTIIFDSNGHCIEANEAYLDLTGRSLEECISSNWLNSVYIMDRQDVQKEWLDAVMNQRISEIEYRIMDTDGNQSKIKSTAVPTMGAGIVIEYVCTIKKL